MLSGCKDNWSYTSWVTWSVILSKFANLSLPIYCTFLVVREYYNIWKKMLTKIFFVLEKFATEKKFKKHDFSLFLRFIVFKHI